ncbi:MAG TPA: hypothetical protein PLJ34_02335 [Hyphomicrobiales bacterium]|nr:hypothetical protein [Hyphomicrobiales bacterium]
MTARHALPLALALSVFALPALASDDDRAAPMSRDWSARAEVTDAARNGADASTAMRSDDRFWKVERDEDEDRDHDRAERGDDHDDDRADRGGNYDNDRAEDRDDDRRS